MTPAELDKTAEHVLYEIDVLVDQVLELDKRSAGDAISIALIEASLAHIRLLDEFFSRTSKPSAYPKQLIARDWVPAWTPIHVISQSDRAAIGERLAHLSAARDAFRDWAIADMTNTCVTTFQTFLTELTYRSAARAKPFEGFTSSTLPRWASATPPLGWITRPAYSSTLWWQAP
jgi:hypothetical protein